MARKLIYGLSGPEWIDAGDVSGYDGAEIYAGGGNDGVGGSYKADRIYGEDGNDQLFGNGGDDSLNGGLGNDSLYGGEGNDLLEDYAGVNVLDGGNGNDTIFASINNDTLSGGDGNDLLGTGEGNNVVYTGNGNDTVYAGNGHDLVTGDTGNDYIWAGGGNNSVYGGVGNDTVVAGNGNDFITGDDGSDSISAGGGNNSVFGGNGDDVVTANTGMQFITGDEGNDTIVASNSSGQFYGGNGSDFLFITGGAAFITGDAGNDSIFSGIDTNQDTIYAGEQNDFVVLFGDVADTVARDIVDGGNGYDTLRLSVTDDIFVSGAFQADLAGLKASMASTPWQAYSFEAVGAKLSGFEKVEVEITLDFDSIPLGSGTEQPLTSYAGFSFEQTGLYNPPGNNGLGYVATSGSNLAFFAEAIGNDAGYPGENGSPMVMRRADGGDFQLTKFFASAASTDNLVVRVEGFNNGAKVGEIEFMVSRNAANQIDVADGLNFGAVDEIRFDAPSFFGIDDMTVII